MARGNTLRVTGRFVFEAFPNTTHNSPPTTSPSSSHLKPFKAPTLETIKEERAEEEVEEEDAKKDAETTTKSKSSYQQMEEAAPKAKLEVDNGGFRIVLFGARGFR